MANQEDNLFKNVISHAKEYGFIFPSSEIYDGLSAVYDYGQNGSELKNNIKEYWWKFMTLLHDNIVGIDAAIATCGSCLGMKWYFEQDDDKLLRSDLPAGLPHMLELIRIDASMILST